TLPLFRGLSPQGKDVFYIITEASDFEVARRMGINYAPKLAEAIGSPGVQNVTLQDGIMKFAGNVDFSPKYKVYPYALSTRKSAGLMMRKLSVTESQKTAQFFGTSSRRKRRTELQKSL